MLIEKIYKSLDVDFIRKHIRDKVHRQILMNIVKSEKELKCKMVRFWFYVYSWKYVHFRELLQ